MSGAEIGRRQMTDSERVLGGSVGGGAMDEAGYVPGLPGTAGAGTGVAPALAGNAPGLAGGGRVVDFRRRGAPPRRRRRSLLLALAKPLGVAVITVALPLGLGAWVLTSRRFQLRDVSVRRRTPVPAAMQRVQAAWVLNALAPLQGRNLPRLPLSEVRQRLAGNRWMAAADVAKELPDCLLVTIAERRPVVLLRSGGETLLFADAAGLPIAPVASPAEAAAARRQGLLVVSFPRPSAPASPVPREPPGPPGADDPLPAVRQAEIAGALRLAAQLRRLRPAWGPALTQIDVVDEDDYQLHVEGLPCPLLVRGSRLAGNLVRFEQLLPELTRRYPALAVVDLRFSRRIVVQPAAAPAAAAGGQRAPANH